MSGRFFLDTNIFVYAFDERSPAKAKRAATLIERAVTSRSGIVSYQVVQEFLNVALKRFDPPMKADEAEQYLVSVFRPLLSVHASHGLFLEALRLKQRYRFAWYDSLIIAGAIEGGCATLYSEDLQDGFRINDLKIENPFTS